MDREWLEAQVKAGLGDKEIALLVGKTVTAVGFWRRKFGILPRPASERTKQAIQEMFPNGRNGPLCPRWKGGRRSTHGKKPGGYIRIYMPDHPFATKGYVYEHRYVMEQQIGRLLHPEEVVDHVDRDRSNNALENLRLHPSRSAHVKDHFNARNEAALLREENVTLRAELARYLEKYGPLEDE